MELYYTLYDYSQLQSYKVRSRRMGKDSITYNSIILCADTETSKMHPNEWDEKEQKWKPVENYVVAWSVAIRDPEKHENVVCLWGNKPSQLCECLHKIMYNLKPASETYCYFHNLSYDYVFLRKFLYREFGTPEKQLATKPHYPINIKFHRLVLKDSLILAQCKVEKWADDLNVEHKKAVGKWDYNKIRTQDEVYTGDELEYICNDVWATAECIDALMTQLNKHLGTLPMTATGIPRAGVKKSGGTKARSGFKKLGQTFYLYRLLKWAYHGGYTHANRYYSGQYLGLDLFKDEKIVCNDFNSSYPYVMMAEKFPIGRFKRVEIENYSWIDAQYFKKQMRDDYCYVLCLEMNRVRLKDWQFPMPVLQKSKCEVLEDAVEDNGRIIACSHCKIIVTDITFNMLCDLYDFEGTVSEVYASKKGYLPKWFRDYVWECWEDKCVKKYTKKTDPVGYSLAKQKVNSLYGMCVQKSIRDIIEENYDTGEYIVSCNESEESYNEYLNKRGNVLPYQWGVWVTEYAFSGLFELGKCCREWIYSDTDSVYGIGWNIDKVNKLNDNRQRKLYDSGYGRNGRTDISNRLGMAELDGEYTEFITLGSKRYACRSTTGELKITVAGVPKTGAESLGDDIRQFRKGFVFRGADTGKLTHTYITGELREQPIEVGDSVDLTPCDYLLDIANGENVNWDELLEVLVRV